MAEPEKTPEAEDLSAHPALRDYTLLCLGALLVIAVLLIQEGVGWFALLPVFVGTGALLAHWSVGPPLVLLLVSGFYLTHFRPTGLLGSLLDEGPLLTNLILAASLVIYLAGSYRLQSMARQVIPSDGRSPSKGAARRLRRWFQPGVPRLRSPDAVRPGEVMRLLLSGLAFAAWGTVTWVYLVAGLLEPPLRLPRFLAHALVLVWIFGMGWAVTAAVLGYLGMRLASREQALLYLQDQFWRQTRSEQSQQQRWWVWGRLRAQRRKERS